MTYRELQKQLNTLFTEEQLDMDVTIYEYTVDEFFKATLLDFQGETDVLDENHPYFVSEKIE